MSGTKGSRRTPGFAEAYDALTDQLSDLARLGPEHDAEALQLAEAVDAMIEAIALEAERRFGQIDVSAIAAGGRADQVDDSTPEARQASSKVGPVAK